MNILVGMEESQAICIALRQRGHNAFSCDLKPSSGGHPEWHIQCNVFDVIKKIKFDAAIFHPDCTYLTVSANKWYKDQPPRKSGKLVGQARREARREAISSFMQCWDCDIPLVAIENPIGIMSTEFRKPDQIIQPWQFGHPETKATCLWTRGLPKLKYTNIVDPIFYEAGGKKYSPMHYLSHSKGNRSELRSKTFHGIAKAISEQWFV